MNWIELLLAAAALVLAAAAFRQTRAPKTDGNGARDAALHQDLALLRDAINALPGRIADETAASPLREAVEAVRESITVLGESLEARTAAARARDAESTTALVGAVKDAVSGLSTPLGALAELQARQLEALAAQTRALEGLAERTGRLSEGVHSGFETTAGLKTPVEGILSSLDGLRGDWTESIHSLRSDLAALPARLAEAAAVHPVPAPELQELALAVRESGTLRGEVERGVARAVAEVGRELSESGARAAEDRMSAAKAMDAALERLEGVASGVRSALEPLEGMLSGQSASVGPLVQALEAARDRLDEAAGTQRANQVEFSATVEIFARAAQELSKGLSLFAREGELEGLADPRQAQNALLEALERLLKGFSGSLGALLSESDLRTRETLAELAARLPGSEGTPLVGAEG